jgi:cytidylate kinase
MAGRDIGTVVLPDADAKVYLTASVGERARRRHLEREARSDAQQYDRVLEELQRRDKIDSERDDSPLRPAEDAVILNTDGVPVEDLVRRILSYIA